MKNVKNEYYINGEIYVNNIVYIEDTDDYIQMNKPAHYYKDEYGICPCCKHKLSKKEMERKRCSKCLQKLSGETIVFTRKGLIKFYLVVNIIILLFIIALCLESIEVILGIAIIVLVILLVWGIVWSVM